MKKPHGLCFSIFALIITTFVATSFAEFAPPESGANAMDPSWAEGFFRAGVNADVRALVFHDGRLYVGGNFSVAGPIGAARVACWDGTAWTPLGTGMNAGVSALVAYDGSLIAGGSFTDAGGVLVSRVARWDGSDWSAFGSFMDGEVRAFAVLGGVLYAGGSFTTADGVAVNRVARWNGATWEPLGSGMNGIVYTLAQYGTDLIAAGAFTQAGGVAANRIARWDGTSWSAIGTGMDGAVFTLCVSDGALFAGGAFNRADGSLVWCVARWNGSAWGGVGGGFPDRVLALADYNGDLIAGGYFWMYGNTKHIARWNGTSWQPMQTGIQGSASDDMFYSFVAALAVFDNRLFAGGGRFLEAGSAPAENIAAWDGSSWSAVGEQGEGLDGPVMSMLLDDGDVIAGGEFEHAGSADALNIARFHDGAWQPIGAGFPGKTWIQTLCHYGSDLVAGVSHWEFHPEQGIPAPPEVFRWDGAAWNSLGVFGGEVGPEMFPEIYAVSAFGSDLVVAGRFLYAGWTHPAVGIARWDGIEWQSLGGGITAPAPGNGFSWAHALVANGGDLIASGVFEAMGDVPAVNIARWDGSAWHAMGGDANTSVGCFAVFNGQVIAGGEFSILGGVAASNVARWDGTAWHALGGGVSGGSPNYPTAVYSLSVHNGALIASGNFTSAGGVPVSGMARWDGTSWSAFSSGLGAGEARVICSAPAGLFVGGSFTTADNKPSYRIARWDSGPVTLAAVGLPRALTLAASPNPFSRQTTVVYEIPRDGHVDLTIIDLTGRRIATLVHEEKPAGRYSASWNARDSHGHAVASGIYFIRLDASGEAKTAKINVAR